MTKADVVHCPRGPIQQFQREKTRVSFVHVKTRDATVAKFIKHSHAADAENNFLVQPIVSVATVKEERERAISLGIFRQVCIE